MARLKVLFSTYGCNPTLGSESGKGWRVVSHMAAHHDVWAITRINNGPAIEQALRENPVPGLSFVYYDLPAWARFWKRGQRGAQIYYYLWQIGAFLHARRLHQEIGFDVVHHYTFAKYWSPSFLSQLPVPFVWGPVGGGESAPRGFSSYFSIRGLIYERLRDLARWCGELDPFVRLTARRSAIAFATTAESQERMVKIGAPDVQVMPAIALDEKDIDLLGSLGAAQGNTVRFLFIGRLLGWKGVAMAVKAFAQAGLSDTELWVVGDGPEEGDLKELAQRLGVAERVTFWGRLPRGEGFAKLGQCHVLVHPSLHDSGGWVCLEAMAAKRPVICLDLGGPGTLVSDDAGIKVSAQSEQQAVEGIASAMSKLAADGELRVKMGEAGRRRVLAHFAWPAKCAELSEAYDGILARAKS